MKIFCFFVVLTGIACALGGEVEDFAVAMLIIVVLFMLTVVFVLRKERISGDGSVDADAVENANARYDARYKGRIKTDALF